MNTVSRTVSGSIIFAFGALTIYRILVASVDLFSLIFGLAVGIFTCGVGVYLFFHKNEDAIEEIKSRKNSKE